MFKITFMLGNKFLKNWEKFKISKILNFWNSNFETCSMLTKGWQFQCFYGHLPLNNVHVYWKFNEAIISSAKFSILLRLTQNPEFRNNPDNFYQMSHNVCWIP